MTMPTPTEAVSTPRPGTLFGVPIGELGWFASFLMATAAGFASFFAATFLAIVSLLCFNAIGHHAVDYSFAYKRVGLPIGLLMLVAAYATMGTFWFRRTLRRA